MRVCAPLELRVKRLMERLETDDEELARHEIEVDDAARAARMGEHFNVNWGDPTLYDLTLNTERVSIAELRATRSWRSPRAAEFQETPASRQVLEDLALQARARAALRADARTAGIDIVMEARAGAITLRGIVVNDARSAQRGAWSSKLPGVEVRRRRAAHHGRRPLPLPVAGEGQGSASPSSRAARDG